MSDMLLDLFREEAEIHLGVLENGLIRAEQEGLDSQGIEPLMRSAHSLKGAARVVGLIPFVEVAHVCEDILVAAQSGKTQINPADFDLLLVATEELKYMASAAGPGFAPWYQANQTRIEALLTALKRRSRNEPIATIATNQGQHSTGDDPPVHPEHPDPKSQTVENDAVDSVQPIQAETKSTPIAFHWDNTPDPGENPLADFFRSEVKKYLDEINAILEVDFPEDTIQKDRFTEIMQDAVQQIRGGALLVGAIPLADLAATMGQGISPLVSDPVCWDQMSPWMKSISDLILKGSEAFAPGFADWARNHASLANELHQQGVALFQQSSERKWVHESDPYHFKSDSSKVQPTSPATAKPISVPAAREKPPKETNQTTKPIHPKQEPGNGSGPSSGSPVTDRVVRVNAQSLEKLIGLAGESLLEARWLQSFSQSLLRLKRDQTILRDQVDTLLDETDFDKVDLERLRRYFKEFRERLSDSSDLLTERMSDFEEHARQSDALNSRLYRETILTRMTPFRNGVQGYSKMVRDISRQLGKEARLEIKGFETEVDRDIMDKLDSPFTHMLRNSLDHGLESPEERKENGKNPTGTLTLEARHAAGSLVIKLSDDGRGVDMERIRQKVVERQLATPEMVERMSEAELLEFLFLPGFSTAGKVTELSGRGVGLDVVHSTITAVGGSVRMTSKAGKGTTFHMQLPLTLSVIRAVLAKVCGDPFAFPHHRVDRLLRIPANSVKSIQDKQFIVVDGRNIGLVMARQVLQIRSPFEKRDEVCVILFTSQHQTYGLVVDEFLGEQDLAVRPLDTRLGKVPYVYAASILNDGAPVLILDLEDLRRGIDRVLEEERLLRTDMADPIDQPSRRKRILVTDDSITVREVQKELLAGKGYEVRTAVDGLDGYHTAREEDFDLIITDIDMPRMNGFEFVSKIRNDDRLKNIPVVVVSYKDREEDRIRGLEVGANYYLTKSSFQDDSLLQVVQELIGEALP